jgi:hypothetical protein
MTLTAQEAIEIAQKKNEFVNQYVQKDIELIEHIIRQKAGLGAFFVTVPYEYLYRVNNSNNLILLHFQEQGFETGNYTNELYFKWKPVEVESSSSDLYHSGYCGH